MLSRHTPLARVTPLHRGEPLATVTVITGGAQVLPLARPKRAKRTGFSDAVKLAVRTRAGNGDIDEARCEATGVWLGRHGGEIQHRDARGMGGTSLEVTDSIVNAVLLSLEAHRLAESRDRAMGAEGFWLRNGEDPAATPILLHSEHGSGVTAWLLPDGRYEFEDPDGGSAA